MHYFFLLCCSMLSLSLHAQRFSSEVFHKGYIVTSNKDTVRGNVKYDMETNALTAIRSGKASSFSSQKVFYFEIFDNIQNNYRQFYSIPFKVNYDYKVPILFELIYEGKVSLMRRERIVTQTVNTNNAYWGGTGATQTVIQYAFYFLDDEGEIVYFSGKKKDLFAYVAKKQNKVKQYIKDNRLDTNQTADLIRIIAFYNSI